MAVLRQYSGAEVVEVVEARQHRVVAVEEARLKMARAAVVERLMRVEAAAAGRSMKARGEVAELPEPELVGSAGAECSVVEEEERRRLAREPWGVAEVGLPQVRCVTGHGPELEEAGGQLRGLRGVAEHSVDR